MSLAVLSGKVGKLSQGIGGLGTSASTMLGGMLYGNFPTRNEEGAIAGIGNMVGGLTSMVGNLSSLAGVKPPIYTIGEVPKPSDKLIDSDNAFVNAISGGINDMASSFNRAVGSITGDQLQRGVIIDGFNQMKGQMSVSLPEQPVQYETSIVNTRVRSPNILTMRVYINNLLSDNILDDLMATAKNAVGGIGALIMGKGESRANKGLSALQYIQEFGISFKVYNPHKVYDNMLIQDIQVITDESSMDTLVADITFKEIIFYQTLNSLNNTPSRTLPTRATSSIAASIGWVQSKIAG